MTNTKEPWHLSKSVPISIIIGFLMQFAGAVWMFSQMDAAISANTADVERNSRQIEVIRDRAQQQAVQLGRIEASISAMHDTLERIAVKLER